MACAAPAAAAPVSVAPGVPGQGRAWELVTSPEPVGASFYNQRAISPDGNRVVYMTTGSTLPGATTGAPDPVANIATRGPDGWVNAPVAAPYPEKEGFQGSFLWWGPEGFDRNLDTWIALRDLSPDPPFLGADGHLFRWGPSGVQTELAALGSHPYVVGMSADLRRIFATSESHLLPADAARTEGRSVYEVDGSIVRLVDVKTDGSLLSTCGSNVPTTGRAANGNIALPQPGAVSADGRRVFVTSRPGCSGPTRVFLRQDHASTTEISASQCTQADCGPEADVSFVGATADGGIAFLVSAERLTDDDTNAHSDLYRYDVADGDLTLLSAPPGGPEVSVSTTYAEGAAAAPHAPFYVTASLDGARVYFIAREWNGTEAVGPCRYYLAAAGEVRQLPGSQENPRLIPTTDQYLQASADGRFAFYASKDPLVAADTDEAFDIYRYDAADGSVVRISAGPAGGNADPGAGGEATIYPEENQESTSTHPFRFVSSDGSRAFFTTAEALVPEDGNQVRDVYEWANGTVGLISSGAGDRSAQFHGMTPDGSTVLFRTAQTLIPRDRDGGQLDLYAARIGGGFPEPAPPSSCEVGCRATASAPPADQAPPTAGALGGRIELRRLGAEELRSAVTTGRLALLVEAPAAGRLTAEAKARLGKRRRAIAAGAVAVSAPGPVQLRLRLSKQARRALRHGSDLHVDLTLGLGPDQRRTWGFLLRGTR